MQKGNRLTYVSNENGKEVTDTKTVIYVDDEIIILSNGIVLNKDTGMEVPSTTIDNRILGYVKYLGYTYKVINRSNPKAILVSNIKRIFIGLISVLWHCFWGIMAFAGGFMHYMVVVVFDISDSLRDYPNTIFWQFVKKYHRKRRGQNKPLLACLEARVHK